MDPVEAEEQQTEPPDDEAYAEADPTGRFIRYDEILGSGAVKTVYKAFDKLEGDEVAWCQTRIDDSVMGSSEKMAQLNTEIGLLKTLRHKNIQKLFASWIDEDKKTVNIITELCTSGSLRQFRKKHNKVGMKAMRGWAIQILAGLEYLHSQEPAIIHRDLKCDNIFINGHDGQVKIGDFGLATFLHQRKMRSIKGTLEFMAPELFTGNYNELVDIYSFGMCMLEMVTCEYPYSECQGKPWIYKKISQPDVLSKVEDAEVRGFIEICLAPVTERLCASELLKNCFLQKDKPIPVPPISVSLVSSVTGDGQQSASLMLWKGEFLLKGDMHVTDHINLSLRFPDPSGCFKNAEFPFDVDQDTSLSVALEMVDAFGLPQGNMQSIAQLIEVFLLILIPEWVPCVAVGRVVVVPESAHSCITKRIMNCRQLRLAVLG
ncbi:putative serine/threonine-protein kinase WNK9 [Hordeum vulgare]|uniref:probable serine/threonine-protein kinase WNK9 isoform X2 n=1 Tax=Hordeum vulgare subsp. vulgare TaxID=112509 RepID=UPI001D1A57C3|nr:probable serine/threonine-protein kinase WNK9 isoform X2 [Hordeum vulgare subsp. vulgare]KAE8813735.1 putative serine/threonine-protein kinase WNK9 [Hordeum vulgare]